MLHGPCSTLRGSGLMPEHSDVYAYFWVEGYVVSHADISARLNLTPTSTSSVGEKGRCGPPSQANSWELLSPLARGEGLLQDYLDSLLCLLEANAAAVRELTSDCSAGINCVGYYHGANPGLHLSATLLARLAALNLPVDFDLYNYGPDGTA